MTTAERLWAVRVWFRTRCYGELWKSVPAVVALLSLMAFSFWATGWTSVVIREQYSRMVRRALAERNFRVARVACERLLGFGTEGRSENLLRLAMAMNGLGHQQEAQVLLGLAAPLDKPGSVEAHLFMARLILGATNGTAQTMSTAEAHLKNALQLDPNSAEANGLLGRLYIQRRNWELAKNQLMKTAGTDARALLLLATVCRALEDDIGARGWADRAVKAYRDRLGNAKGDSPLDRCALAQGLVMQEKYADALKVLEDGAKLSGIGTYGSALAEVCAAWAQALAINEPRNLAQRVRLVQEGLSFAPQNIKLLRLLVELSHMEGEQGKEAREAMTRTLAEGGSTAILHFVLGSDAWERGDMGSAGKHYSLAFEMAPSLPVVANNMAAFLAMGQKPDLPRALGIIQALLEKYPTDPYFRDTRGQILVRLQRWSEGVKDLEFALPQLPAKGPTHAALAAAYQGLGMAELASEHQKAARAEGKAATNP